MTHTPESRKRREVVETHEESHKGSLSVERIREREREKAVDEEEIEEYKTRQSAALYSR